MTVHVGDGDLGMNDQVSLIMIIISPSFSSNFPILSLRRRGGEGKRDEQVERLVT